jgi:hypothetical protein
MRASFTVAGAILLLAVGYILGASNVLSPSLLLAQPGGAAGGARGGDAGPSDEAKAKIKAAAEALRVAMQALQDENRYSSAIKGTNAFAVLSGGDRSLDDLKEAAVVDPETYAALYAGLETDAVASQLSRDAEGKLMFDNKVIRMYPISMVRAKYAARAEMTGEDILPQQPEPSDKGSKAKKSSGKAGRE